MVSKTNLISVILASLLVSQTGCLTLSSFMGKKGSSLDLSSLKAQGYNLPAGGMPSPVSPELLTNNSIVLEVRADQSKPHLESIPLPSDKPSTIQDFVRQSNLTKKLGAMDVSIMRRSGNGAPPVRLNASVDDKGKLASVGQNYAIFPGDHLIVVPDNRSSLEKLVDKHFKN